MKKNILFSFAVGCICFANANTIFEEQKISVYNVPHNEVENLDATKLKSYSSTKPLYTVKQGVSPGKTMMKTEEDGIVLVIDKNRNPITNYNEILLLAEKYANANIPFVDKQRISNALKLARLQTSYSESKYKKENNQELIVAISENKNKNSNGKNIATTSSGIDISELSLIDTINYFIDNYTKINKNQTNDISKDIRLSLVKSIKQKATKYSNIDESAIDYYISLDELKLLRTTIINYNN